MIGPDPAHPAAPDRRLPFLGDIGLTHGRGFVDWWIRWAEARRYGSRSLEAEWNHAFLVVDVDGRAIVEATGGGVRRASIDQYMLTPHMILRPPYPSTAGSAIAAMEAMVGSRYGWLEIACEGLAFLTQTRLRFGVAGEHICSGAVSHAVARAGIDMGDDEEWNSPADVLHVAREGRWLAWTWDVGARAYQPTGLHP